MKILIIRHGDPDYVNDSLTDKGWREAELLSLRLSKLDIRDMYCSPLGRAQATAKPTLEKLQRDVVTLPWLTEFSGTIIGPSEERRRIPWNLTPQFWSIYPRLYDREHWLEEPFMAAGDVPEVYRRTCEGMDALLESYGYHRNGLMFDCENNTSDTIVLFCHFALGLNILAHMLGVALPVMWQCFFLPTSSVTTLITEERMKGQVFFKCHSIGDTSHLYAAGEPVSTAGSFAEVFDDGFKIR